MNRYTHQPRSREKRNQTRLSSMTKEDLQKAHEIKTHNDVNDGRFEDKV